MSSAKTVILKDPTSVTEIVCKTIVERANDTISRNGVFYVGLSGGSLPSMLSKGFPSLATDWSKWRVFFCDERHCPLDDPDSSYGLYKKLLLPQVALTDEQIVKINPNLSVDESASDYETRMRNSFPDPSATPQFDVLVMGIGPDGHTCSLFPQHKLLQEEKLLIAPISDSPKPPPRRITMTLPLINNCHYAMFVACGQGKAQTLKRILVEGEPLPSALVQPTHGEVTWFLDEPAASLLTKT